MTDNYLNILGESRVKASLLYETSGVSMPISAWIFSVEGGSIVLVLQNISNINTIVNIGLIQHNHLAISNLFESNAIGNIVLVQHNVLIVQPLINGNILSNILLVQHNALTFHSLANSNILDNIYITQGYDLVLQGLQQYNTISTLDLLQHNKLYIQNISNVNAIDNIIVTAHSNSHAYSLNIASLASNNRIDALTLVIGILMAKISADKLTSNPYYANLEIYFLLQPEKHMLYVYNRKKV
jgi:hypothetical protein